MKPLKLILNHVTILTDIPFAPTFYRVTITDAALEWDMTDRESSDDFLTYSSKFDKTPIPAIMERNSDEVEYDTIARVVNSHTLIIPNDESEPHLTMAHIGDFHYFVTSDRKYAFTLDPTPIGSIHTEFLKQIALCEKRLAPDRTLDALDQVARTGPLTDAVEFKHPSIKHVYIKNMFESLVAIHRRNGDSLEKEMESLDGLLSEDFDVIGLLKKD